MLTQYSLIGELSNSYHSQTKIESEMRHEMQITITKQCLRPTQLNIDMN